MPCTAGKYPSIKHYSFRSHSLAHWIVSVLRYSTEPVHSLQDKDSASGHVSDFRKWLFRAWVECYCSKRSFKQAHCAWNIYTVHWYLKNNPSTQTTDLIKEEKECLTSSDLVRRTLPLAGIWCCYLMTNPNFSTFNVGGELQIIVLVCCAWEEAGAPQEGSKPLAALTYSGTEQEGEGTQEVPVLLVVFNLMRGTSQMLCKVHTQAGTRPKLLLQSM